ncbi:MAG TPA: hypothetical protein VGK73_37905 [Polyangiaceae bacterium]
MIELTTERALILAVVLALTVVAIGFFAGRSRSRKLRGSLRQRFGREYDRAVEEYGDTEEAEKALLDRAKRVNRFKVHALRDADRTRYAEDWRAVQARFVDDPSGAVQAADHLIESVMRARGYPIEDFEQRVEDLSVDHGDVVQHYRAAIALSRANREGRANTEELRQAFVHYRALFADLLDEPEWSGHELHGARA